MSHVTVDRYEVAYLLSEGHALLTVGIKDGSKLVQFTFEQTPALEVGLLAFTNQASLQRFLRALDQVGKMIRAEQDRHGAQRTIHGRGQHALQ